MNEGNDKDGIPHFKEMAAAYGLNDSTQGTSSAFFDYDNDGDLDVYLVVNEIVKNQYPNTFRRILKNGEHPNTDRLLRNDWSDSLNHPVFTNVSREAGILQEGYGHAVSIVDINMDGYKDIYVTNDFLSPNLLYINDGAGHFQNRAEEYFKHTAENAMGQAIADINNDGLEDIIELDMNPEDNYRKKMMLNPLFYSRYQNNEEYGYQHQYVRNVLQLNRGFVKTDSSTRPLFSDIGFYAGLAETDWSWTPLLADFDNDGFRDLIVTNGFPKDVTDHDFIAYRQKSAMFTSKKDLLDNIPIVKIHNYAYRNEGDLKFTDKTKDWGLTEPSFSNGAVYADLDNDGDLDIVMNNTNQEAFLYRNNLSGTEANEHHFLEIKLEGSAKNPSGIGAWIQLYINGQAQVFENSPFRGYLSSAQPAPHFGLGRAAKADSVIVTWPEGRRQRIENVAADQVLTVRLADASPSPRVPAIPGQDEKPLFAAYNAQAALAYTDMNPDFIDFNIQGLLPHKLSEYGPGLAVADLNGDGLDDMICGGSFTQSAMLFFQQPNGQFRQEPLTSGEGKHSEDMGLLIFDADGDGDNDIYIAAGGYEAKGGTDAYRDNLYLNDGSGHFSSSGGIPQNLVSKSAVRGADFDNDGDIDLFLAGRVDPGNYPKNVSSFIYRNDSENGNVAFTDISKTAAPVLDSLGMLTDALWTDIDNDGWYDLLVCGEWMPITILHNEKGSFKSITTVEGSSGWWNSLVSGDFDNDGDIDYVSGNLGSNTFYQGNKEYPLSVYYKDFDKNGTQECILTRYLKNQEGQMTEFTTHLRDPVMEQLPFLKKRYLSYQSFAQTPFTNLFTEEEKKDLQKKQATYFQSAYLENNGNGQLILHALPAEAQFSPVFGMIAGDFNGDGNLDIAMNANDFSTDVATGRYDAADGLLLEGDGNGGFKALSPGKSGIYIPGNGKAFVELRNKQNQLLLAASQNKGSLLLFEKQSTDSLIAMEKNDRRVELELGNGKKQVRELYWGNSYLSQSARFILITDSVRAARIFAANGATRTIRFRQ